VAALTLSVLRCPDRVVPGQRRATGGEVSLGRGAECDWQLEDPDRVLSKRHCVVEFYNGGWQVRDLSTNGTFVNHGADALGRDQVRSLRDGDRLRLGLYEIEVRIEEGGAPGWGAADPFAAPPPSPGFSGVPLPGLGAAPAAPGGSVLLPPDFDPFADAATPMPDHAPATAEAFLPRPVLPTGKALIPDDWDLDLSPAPAAAPAPVLPMPAATLSIPTPPLAPAMPEGMNPFLESEAPAPLIPVPAPRPTAPPATAAMTTAPVAATAPAPGLTAALFEGAGLPAALAARAAADPDATLHGAGALLRAAVAGMRALLIARADVKREFRIEQTMLRAAGNNPVKFAATEEQALAALLDPKGNALAAIQETVDDLVVHQVATLAATQAAARALLERLAPGPIEADDAGGGLLPGAREKRIAAAMRSFSNSSRMISIAPSARPSPAPMSRRRPGGRGTRSAAGQ
jgi:type VI secretion system protein ImpI/type VI secretion system protein